MIRTLIWKPPSAGNTTADTSARAHAMAARRAPPPPGAHVYGPARDERYWEPVGISVDEDTLPHILTFTSCSYKGACESSATELDRPTVSVSPALQAVLAHGKGEL